MPTLHIVVDTNLLFRDLLLTGSTSSKLRSARQVLDAQIVVPEVVLDEMEAHFARQVEEQRGVLKKLGRDLGRLGVEFAGDDALGATEVADYRSVIETRLRNYGWKVLPYSSPPHQEVARRAAAKRPPFSPNGRGYRDTLLWYAVRALANAEPGEIVLITADKVFTEGSGLAGALQDDLAEDGTSGRVTLVPTMTDLYKGRIEPAELKLSKLRDEFNSTPDLQDRIADVVDSYVESAVLDRYLVAEVGPGRVSRVDRVELLDAVEATELWREGAETWLEGRVEVEVTFDLDLSDDWNQRTANMYGYIECIWRAVIEDEDLDTLSPDNFDRSGLAVVSERRR